MAEPLTGNLNKTCLRSFYLRDLTGKSTDMSFARVELRHYELVDYPEKVNILKI